MERSRIIGYNVGVASEATCKTVERCAPRGSDRCRSGYRTCAHQKFAAAAHRQSAAIAAGEHEAEDQAFAAARGAYTGEPRPVVIIQDDRFDAIASVTVCPMTTIPVDAPLMRIAVEPTAATGIEQSSHVMVDKITTMPRANVRDLLGRLAGEDLVRLDRALLVFLGLAD